MIVDELVTLLRYEMAPGSQTALQNTTKGSDSLVKSFGRVDPAAKKLTQSLGSIGAKLSTIGIGAAVAGSGLMAALGAMTISEAKQADQLMKLSGVLGTNADELSLWSAAITSAGGNASAFLSDIQKLKGEWLDFSLDDVLEAANELASLPEVEAFSRGAAMGYGEDSVRFMRQGAEGIRTALAEAQRLGQGSLQKHLDDLQEVHQKYSSLGETFDGIRNRFAGVLAPGVSGALDLINQSLAANNEKIVEWATSANAKLEGFVDAVKGNLGVAEDAISHFNGMLVSDNMKSPDQEVRKKNIDELADRLQGQAGAIGWEALGGILPHYNPETGFNWSPIEALKKAFGKMESAADPLHQAAQTDWQMKMGDNASDTGDPLKDWFNDYRTHHKLPGAGAAKKVSELTMSNYIDPSKALDMADPYSPQAMQDSLEQMYGPPPVRNHTLEPKPDTYLDMGLDQLARDVSAVPMPMQREERAAAGPTGSARASRSIDGEEGGVKIENQTVHININGAGDPTEVGRQTVEQMENAAKRGDHIPFFW